MAKTKPQETILHESDNKGRHRIVILKGDGTSVTGDWKLDSELARVGQYIGHTGAADPELPLGVFTVREVANQMALA